MRIVLVCQSHPDTPHVSATRMREFARALADHGHRVALLTQPIAHSHHVPSATDISDMLKAGVEPSPMIVATLPKRSAVLNLLRRGLWPWGIRQGIIAYHYLRHGGLNADWRAGARPYIRVLAADFKPDIVWATFGNTDSWTIAQEISRTARCPWVADIKDFWASFIPGPLRARIAARYGDAAGWTALSRTHAEAACPWFGTQITPIYSGFDATSIRAGNPVSAGDPLLLTLTGSVYGGGALTALFAALSAWANKKPDDIRKRLLLIYRGNDQYEVGAALARAKLPFQAKAGGFVPLDELQALHQHAFANLYVTNARTFHHKTIELLAARRPIVAFPPDHVEAEEITERAGGMFFNCDNASDIGAALDAALAEFNAPDRPVPAGLSDLTWSAQARALERLFEDVVKSNQAKRSA